MITYLFVIMRILIIIRFLQDMLFFKSYKMRRALNTKTLNTINITTLKGKTVHQEGVQLALSSGRSMSIYDLLVIRHQ